MSAATSKRFNPSYVGQRPDLAVLVPPGADSVLDVGCATGALGRYLRAQWGTRVTGIERDPAMADAAAAVLDRVIRVDLDDLDAVCAALGDERFDCVVLGDVLEHLVDPWTLLSRLHDHVAADGSIVVSIPNVGFYATPLSLLFRQRWPYRERGTHDSTHLRFFARRNFDALVTGAGFEIVEDRPTFRLIERPHRINRLARPLGRVPGVRSLLLYQFVARATRADRVPTRRVTPAHDAPPWSR